MLLAAGASKPPIDFKLAWAILPALGFVVGIWLAERYRERFRHRNGWRGKVGIFLDSIHLVRAMFARPREHGLG